MTLHYRDLPDVTGVDLGPLPPQGGTPFWAVIVPASAPGRAGRGPAGAGYAARGKRLLDIVAATLALVLSAPVLVLLIAALWVEGGRPIYTQERIGLNGRRFRMIKLRTMVIDADQCLTACLDRDPALRAEWDLTQKLKNDPRITPLGRLLRKTSLDELPQVLNILRGDMSLVGPRPMLPEQMPLHRNAEAYLALRPGLTGLWQVTARNESSFERRAMLDGLYARRLSLRGDLRIILATFGAVWNATGY